MIAAMAIAPGTHELGPRDGRVEVHTFREGLAQRAGHDLIIEVTDWKARVEATPEGGLASIAFEADPRSLEVREGRHGVKPLTDSDRQEIKRNIEEKVLGTQAIRFQSSAIESVGGLTVRGELEIAGRRRPESFELELADGRVRGRLPIVQSEFGIKPYRAFMGALKVRDEVEVEFDVALPGA
jgi:polyisoprenoid-binding protein YceI